jgi:hypothetical protein
MRRLLALAAERPEERGVDAETLLSGAAYALDLPRVQVRSRLSTALLPHPGLAATTSHVFGRGCHAAGVRRSSTARTVRPWTSLKQKRCILP